jgi:broad specificity phosphatase PhoE
MASALTPKVLKGDAPMAPREPRTGTIMLARHGEPALSRAVKLNAAGYRDFWATYEVGGLAPDQAPPAELLAFVAKADVVMVSTRRRSVESAQILTRGKAFTQDPILIEAPLPPPRWPSWVKLSPKIWGFWARFHWWYFNHHEGQESRRQAEARVDQAMQMMIDLAEAGQDVAVVAHGFFNFMMGRALRRRGWTMTKSQGFKYWSTRRFEKA